MAFPSQVPAACMVTHCPSQVPAACMVTHCPIPRDLAKLQAESSTAGGKLMVKVDGKAVSLTVGKEVFFSAAAAAGLL